MKTVDYDISTVGGRVREQRIRNNLSQDELAKRLTTTRERINKVENNRDKSWTDSRSLFGSLVDILDTTEKYILEGKTTRPNFRPIKTLRKMLHTEISTGFPTIYSQEIISDDAILSDLHVALDEFFCEDIEKVGNITLAKAIEKALYYNINVYSMHIPPREEYDIQTKLLTKIKKEISEIEQKNNFEAAKIAAEKIKGCICGLLSSGLSSDELNTFFYLSDRYAECFRYLYCGRNLRLGGVNVDSFQLSDYVDLIYKTPLARNVCTIDDAAALGDRMDASSTYDWVGLLADTYDNNHPFILPEIEHDDDGYSTLTDIFPWNSDSPLTGLRRTKIRLDYEKRMEKLGIKVEPRWYIKTLERLR